VAEAEAIIEVGMADSKVSKAPVKLITRALGSCVGVVIYDPSRKSGAMAHSMLPDIDKARIKSNPSRFVNSAINNIIEELEKNGSQRSRLTAKLFGGAQMFSFITPESTLNIGQKNVQMAHEILDQLGIKIIAEETGGTFGRTITLDLETGRVLIETVSWGSKEV